MEEIFKESANIYRSNIEDEVVNIDAAVQEKNITYPTGGKLAIKIIDRLNKLAKNYGVKQWRTYVVPR